MKVVTYQVKLIKKEPITPDAWIFYFRKPKSLLYHAGQYIKMWMEIDDPDSRGITRYFTLTSSPIEDHLKVTTRILRSSFKKKLESLKTGTKVKIRGPWGDFFLSPEKHKKIVFLSGGIGITPYRSMIKSAVDQKLDVSITLIASYKTPDEIFFNQELAETAAIYKNIKVINTITQPEGTEWKGETGRINPEMLKRHLDKLEDYIYYIAGPDPLVDALHKMLKVMKIAEKNILTDGFPGY